MPSAEDPVVIVSYARTPIGALLGELAPLSANELGAAAVKAALERAVLAAGDVDHIYMGNVLPAGQGQAPARQAATTAAVTPAARPAVIPVTRSFIGTCPGEFVSNRGRFEGGSQRLTERQGRSDRVAGGGGWPALE